MALLSEKADVKHHVPEQAQGKKYPADQESEVWPLGVRLNEREEFVRRSITVLPGLWYTPHKGI